jgi:hypothetical protein
MATVPGPDATEYTGWARSGDPDAARELTVRSTAKAIRSVAGPYHRERAWLPILDALLVELTTGRAMPEADVRRLVARRENDARMLHAREVAETALDAIGAKYDSRDLERAAEAIQYMIGGAS